MRLILIALLMPLFAYGQDKGYFVKDSVYSEGFIKVRHLNKPSELFFSRKDKGTAIIEYPLSSISEFGFGDGRKFIKKVFPSYNAGRPYFYTILMDNPFKIYSLPRRIGKGAFVVKDSTTIRLTRRTYRSTLLELTKTSPDLSAHIKLLSFNAKSIRRLATLTKKNYTGLFPRVRIGITAGYSNTDISIQNRTKSTLLSGNDVSPFIGIFIDTPIAMNPRWLANFQLSYQINSYSLAVNEFAKENNYLINTATVRIPLMVKYTSTAPKFRYFAVAGPTLDFNIRRETTLYSVKPGTAIEFTKENLDDSIRPFYVNATVGVGFEYSVTLKNAISIELRHLNSLGASGSQSISGFQLAGLLYF